MSKYLYQLIVFSTVILSSYSAAFAGDRKDYAPPFIDLASVEDPEFLVVWPGIVGPPIYKKTDWEKTLKLVQTDPFLFGYQGWSRP
jgi:hypothetical protein